MSAQKEPKAGPPAEQTWEAEIVEIHGDVSSDNEVLSQYCADGWEPIAITDKQILFKREYLVSRKRREP